MDERPAPTGLERPPRARPETVAAGAGLLWGAFCYSILWQGTPFAVDRRFVGSVPGTLVLLPARAVLWAVRAAELVAGRTFGLADSAWVFGVGSCAAGALLGLLMVFAARGAAILIRR